MLPALRDAPVTELRALRALRAFRALRALRVRHPSLSNSHTRSLLLLLVALTLPLALAASDDVADESMRQFLAKDDGLRPYRATRRLEAENGTRSGWLEAITEYSPQSGFRYRVTAEGGSGFVRDKVLRVVLDAERDLIARKQSDRFALAHANYTFKPKSVDADGLAAILLSPKREDHVLLAGTMFLRPVDGELVRLTGRLVKNPSFWVKGVELTRHYQRIADVVVPVALYSHAQLRLFGAATFRMSYAYSEIDGRALTPSAAE